MCVIIEIYFPINLEALPGLQPYRGVALGAPGDRLPGTKVSWPQSFQVQSSELPNRLGFRKPGQGYVRQRALHTTTAGFLLTRGVCFTSFDNRRD